MLWKSLLFWLESVWNFPWEIWWPKGYVIISIFFNHGMLPTTNLVYTKADVTNTEQ